MPRVSKRLRYEVLRRDGFRCRYCGATPEQAELRIDHVVPESLGGRTEPSNLATACDPCNSGKSSVPPEAPVVEQVAEDALRWSAAMQRAAADMEAKLRERDDQNAVFLEEWNGYTCDNGKNLPLDPTWNATIVRLRTAGLTDRLIIEAVSATMGAQNVLPENRFRYFCGVSWNMISQLQEAAEKMAADGDGNATFYKDMDPDDLDAALAGFEINAEGFLKQLPTWIRDAAEQAALHDFDCAELPADRRIDVLPHVVRHVGNILATSTIHPEREAD